MTAEGERRITVDYLARVEGEGSMNVRVVDGVVEDVEFGIFEPPRFFEAFLRGRPLTDAPDLTARICGICPVAYQMSAVQAMEAATATPPPSGALRALRRLVYCGEWIESHVLHIYMLHAPDFLGVDSAVHLAATHRDIVERGLRLKKAGNAVVTAVGGREVHPVNVRVGGFYRAPTRRDLDALVPELEWAREAALETVTWAASLPMPDVEIDVEYVSLSHPDEYPLNEGRIVSSRGLDIDAAEYDEWFEEHHVARSNALHSRIRGRGAYLVGPTARFNLCFDRLPPEIQSIAVAAGVRPPSRNPFRSIIVRAVETLYAVDEALRIIDRYERPDTPAVPLGPRIGVGHGVTEAPRGLLYHRYEIDDEHRIVDARIVPPTSQNQLSIEADLREVLELHLHLPDDELRWKLEQTIRNYDPCISCATHFLDLRIERTRSERPPTGG